MERSWKSRLIGSRNSRSRFANVDLGRCLENRYQSRLCALLYAPLVTNADDKIEEHSPESVGTHYLFTMDEAIEHLHAANLLGFGVRLHSYLAPVEDGAYEVRWELEVLTDSPVQTDDEDEAGLPEGS